jgi:tetratricopeptide (TPR) repeat protein
MRQGAHSLALACALAFAVSGCGASPEGTRIKQDLRVMSDERTADKLTARGKAFASVGDLTRAEQYFSAALDQGADYAAVLPLLLRVCIEARRYRVAIDYAEPLLKRHPDDYALRFVVASLYSTIGEEERAREELEWLVTEKPEEANVHFALAVLFRDQARDPVKADTHFREYLRLAPGGAHADEARASLLKAVP